MLNAYFESILLSFAERLTEILSTFLIFCFESGMFTPNIAIKSVKLLAVGCRFPPKGENFGTLHTER